jgi:PEP-CTERM motif
MTLHAAFKSVLSGAVIALAASTPAHAVLTLNQTGVDLGFTLSTFLSGYSAQYGPLSQGVLSNGQIITGSLLNQRIYVFNDVDGQTLSNAVSATPYVCETGNCNYSIATAGGRVYGAQAFGGVFYEFNISGARTPIANLQTAGVTGYLGMWGNPIDGHLISSTNRGLADINPTTGTLRIINANVFPDGVTVSPDGGTLYAEVGGGISSYNVATGALIRSFATGHAPDGTGVISGGSLNGLVVVNNNDGTVGLLDPSKANGDPLLYRIIATGGTRGDFVSADLNNGTLFLSQNEQVARLSCGTGCSIGSTGGGGDVTPAVPEPTTMALMLAGLGALAWQRRARRS